MGSAPGPASLGRAAGGHDPEGGGLKPAQEPQDSSPGHPCGLMQRQEKIQDASEPSSLEKVAGQSDSQEHRHGRRGHQTGLARGGGQTALLQTRKNRWSHCLLLVQTHFSIYIMSFFFLNVLFIEV